MIHTSIDEAALRAAIEAQSPGWLADAKQRTKVAKAAGKVAEGTGTWSKIKEVYIALQHNKCAYCEKAMAKTTQDSGEMVAVEYDVEHYRPKNRVTSWPTEKVKQRRPAIDYEAQIKDGVAQGYVRLAFDPLNYLVSCKVCNSQYKADRFPLLGKPDNRLVKRSSLDKKEIPALLFPVGDWGDDPSRYLAFVGPLVIARTGPKARRLRARVTIDFFELDTREDLIEARAKIITLLFLQLERTLKGPAAERNKAKAFVSALQEPRFSHSACARAFVALYKSARAQAKQVHDAAFDYLLTRDRSLLGL